MFPVSVILPVFRDAEALARTLAATDFTGADLIVSSTPDDDSLATLRLALILLYFCGVAPARWPGPARPGEARPSGAAALAYVLIMKADTSGVTGAPSPASKGQPTC